MTVPQAFTSWSEWAAQLRSREPMIELPGLGLCTACMNVDLTRIVDGVHPEGRALVISGQIGPPGPVSPLGGHTPWMGYLDREALGELLDRAEAGLVDLRDERVWAGVGATRE